MSFYRKKWIELLKNQPDRDWQVMEHGQAIVIKVPADKDFESIRSTLPELISQLETAAGEPKEWLKIIVHNSRNWLQFILNDESSVAPN